MINHRFVGDPFGRDTCDAKLDVNGRFETCARPRREHVVDDEQEALAAARIAWERTHPSIRQARRNPPHFSDPDSE